MIALIFISAAVHSLAARQTAAELDAKRSPFLKSLSTSPVVPLSKLASHIGHLLSFSDKAGYNAWFDFAAGPAFNADAHNWNPEDQADEDLKVVALRLVDQYLPPVNSAQEKEQEAHNAQDQGYGIQIPYLFRAYWDAAERHIVRQMHKNIRAHQQGVKDLPPLRPEDADQVFIKAVYARLKEYTTKYKDAIKATADKNAFIKKANELLQGASSSFNEQLNSFHANNYGRLHKLYQFYINLLNNFMQEGNYLQAVAAEASAQDLPQILEQITEVSKVQLQIAQAGISPFSVKDLLGNWASAYVTAHKDKSPDNAHFKNEVAGKVFAAIAQAIREEVDNEEALKFVENLVRYRVGTSVGIGSDHLFARDLEALPYDDKPAHHGQEAKVAAAKAWNFLSEVKASSPQEQIAANAWFFKNFAHVADILSVSDSTIAVLNTGRSLFTTTLLPAAHTDFYAELYQALVGFALTADGVTKANFAQQFDAYIDAHHADSRFYVILKLHVLNMARNGGYQVTFKSSNAQLAEQTNELFKDEAYAYYLNGFLAANQEITGDDTMPKDQLAMVKTVLGHGAIDSKVLGVIQWSGQTEATKEKIMI